MTAARPSNDSTHDPRTPWGLARRPMPAEPPSELRAVLLFLRRNWPFILLSGIALMLAAGAVSAILPARYTATASLIVESQRPRPTVEAIAPTEDAGYVETQILTIGSDLILAPVVRTLRLADDAEFTRIRGTLRQLFPGPPWPEGEVGAVLRERAAIAGLQRRLRVRRIGTSFVADVAVTSVDADKAATVANLIASTFIEDQRRLTALVTGRAEARIATRTIAPAAPPIEPAGPGRLVILAVAAIAGLVGGAGIAAMREVLDRRLRTPEEVEAATGLPCPAALPRLRESESGKPPPVPSFLPGLRALLPLLETRRPETGPLVIGITALSQEAGRMTLAANLAAFATQLGRPVILLEGTADGAAERTMGDAPPHSIVVVRVPLVPELSTAPTTIAHLHAVVLVVDWAAVEARTIMGGLRMLPATLPVAIVLNRARERMAGLWY